VLLKYRPLRSNFTPVLAMPAGGVRVAAIVAEHLHLHLDVLVVSKITLPFAKLLIGSKAFEVKGRFLGSQINP